jgi:hypothetical protein
MTTQTSNGERGTYAQTMAAWEGQTAPTSLFRIYFAVGTDHFGRRLQTSTVQRAINLDAAIDQLATQGIPREAVTGHEQIEAAR